MTKTIKKTLAIGIPVFNEAANIGELLSSLLQQDDSNFVLQEIIVANDASTDETADIVRAVNNPRVTLLDMQDRKGQAVRQNDIVKRFSSDILVLFNGDVLPKDSSFLSALVEPFYHDEKLGLVSVSHTPLPAETFIEKVLSSSVRLKDKIFAEVKQKSNFYHCRGGVRAFSRSFIHSFSWKPTLAEDTFSYLACLQQGFHFFYVDDTSAWYRLPQTLRDHFNQSVRFLHSKKTLLEYFDSEVVDKIYKIPKTRLIKHVVFHFFREPFLIASYALIYAAALIKARLVHKTSLTWNMSSSSKTLIKK